MATVPEYRRQVLPGAQPVPQMAPDFRGEEFGAAAGFQVEQIGIELQRDQDKADAYKAVRLARLDANELWLGENGGRYKAGQKYFEWARDTADPFLKSMPDRLQGLSPGARAFAEPLLDDVAEDFDIRVKAQSGDAHTQMRTGELASDIESISNNARLGATDPTDPKGGLVAVQAGLDEGAFRIREFANDHPEMIGDMPVEQWVAEKVGNYESDLVAASIDDALKAGQPQLAQQYLTEHGHRLKPDARNAVRASMETADGIEQIARVYEFLSTGMPIMVGDDAPEQAKANNQFYRQPSAQIENWVTSVRAIGKRQGWPQKRIEEAVDYVNERANKELKRQRERQAEVTQSLASDLAASGGDIVGLEARRPADFRFVEQYNRDLLKKDAAAINGERSDAMEMANYLTFVRMAVYDPESFKALDDYEIIAKTKPEHATKLFAMRKEGVQSGIMSPYQTVIEHIERMDYGEDRAGAFWAEVEKMWAQEGGADKVGIVDLRKRLSNMSAEKEVTGWFEKNKQRFETSLSHITYEDIPAEWLPVVIAAVAPHVPQGASDLEKQARVRARYVAMLRSGMIPP